MGFFQVEFIYSAYVSLFRVCDFSTVFPISKFSGKLSQIILTSVQDTALVYVFLVHVVDYKFSRISGALLPIQCTSPLIPQLFQILYAPECSSDPKFIGKIIGWTGWRHSRMDTALCSLSFTQKDFRVTDYSSRGRCDHCVMQVPLLVQCAKRWFFYVQYTGILSVVIAFAVGRKFP